MSLASCRSGDILQLPAVKGKTHVILDKSCYKT